jgi:Zn-finger in Ran binding protein and others
MSTDLFQILALALLAAIAILVALAFSALVRVRQVLESRAPAGAEPAPQGAEPAPSSSVSVLPTADRGSSAGTGPSDQAAFGTSEGVAHVPEIRAEDPQEQPFERDGRWWFRRGDELLVYDEQTGQWMAAAGDTGGASAALGGAESGGAAAAVATQARPATYSDQEQIGAYSTGFWKCPACGAVNGSTATSCRMCFSVRPQ